MIRPAYVKMVRPTLIRPTLIRLTLIRLTLIRPAYVKVVIFGSTCFSFKIPIFSNTIFIVISL